MDEISLCRLCLANSETVQIHVADDDIELILKKHNVSFEKQNHNGILDYSNMIRHICEICWGKVATFDEFYVRVERIHHMYMANELKRAEEAVEEKTDINDEHVNIVNPVDTATLATINDIETDIKSEEDDAKLVDDIVEKIATQKARKYSISDSDENSDSSSDSVPLQVVKRRKIKKRTVTRKVERPVRRAAKDKEKSFQIAESTEEDDMKLVLKYVKMKCDICCHDETFNTFSDCKRHYRDVHNENGYVLCCNRKFRRIVRVVQHCIWHENPEAFKCPTCGKCFQDSIRLRDHITSMHVPNDEKRFQCELCSRLFAKQHLLNTHLKIKHTEKEDRPFACTEPDCDQRFVMPALLRFHIDKVHNLGDSRVCDICARFFKCSKSYERHYQVEHTNIDQRVQCDLCQKWFKHLDTLKEHIRRHKAARAQCKYCGRESSNKKSLRLHVRNVHADIDNTVKSRNEYPCTVCGKIFKKKQTLREHVTLHTGEAFLYSCTFCSKTFRSSANMYAHRKRNHPKEYEEKCVQAKFHAGKIDEDASQSNADESIQNLPATSNNVKTFVFSNLNTNENEVDCTVTASINHANKL